MDVQPPFIHVGRQEMNEILTTNAFPKVKCVNSNLRKAWMKYLHKLEHFRIKSTQNTEISLPDTKPLLRGTNKSHIKTQLFCLPYLHCFILFFSIYCKKIVDLCVSYIIIMVQHTHMSFNRKKKRFEDKVNLCFVFYL